MGHRAGRPYFPGGRALKAHIPVAVIGGYLGAGKTTLVNHLLRHAAGRRIAILVNEFGDLPIDEDLIEAEGEDMIAISGGCICCSFGSDLTAALIKLSELAPLPDHVVIEASGVAMPGTVALSISILPGFALAGVVVLADGERVQALAEDDYIGDTILRQLSDADVIVHSKTDLQPDDGAVEAVESWLQAMAPQAKIVPTTQGRVPPDIILGLTGPNVKPQASPHADAGYESRVFRHIPPCVPGDLAQKLATGPYGVIRAKGFLRDWEGASWVIQTVGQRFEAQRSQKLDPAGLVCIGRRGALDTAALEALLGLAG
ncbi:GTP-binding protein [Planktomarina temperata]|nr:GTP-binding protein [Planktomarina temperata]